jgi:hypothetical protein
MIVRLPDGRIVYTDGKGFGFILTGPEERPAASSKIALIPSDSSSGGSPPSTGTSPPRDLVN